MNFNHRLSKFAPFFVTLACVTSIALIKVVLNHFFKIESPLLLFFSAVTLSAWYGGFYQGLLATVISAFIVRFHFEASAPYATDYIWTFRYIFFLVDGAIISTICGLLKNSRDRVHKSESRLRKIFESNMIGLTFSDSNGNLINVNDYFLNLLGYSRTDFLQKRFNWKDLTPPEHIESSAHAHLEISKGNYFEPFEKEYLRKDGSRVSVLVGATRIDKNSFVAFVLDITEINKTQQELSQAKTLLEDRVLQRTQQLSDSTEQLRQSRSFLDSIIENIPNMIFVKDASDLRFVSFNRAGEQLLGRSRDDLIGKNDFDFFPQSEAEFFTQKDQEVIRQRTVVDIPEEPISTAKGEIRFLHTKKIPVYDKNEKPLFLMGISEDITERKQAEVQRLELIQAQAARSAAEKQSERMAFLMEAANEASRAKSAFLANISHEIRTPLGAMLGFTELVLEDKNLKSEYVQYLSTIQRNGRQLLRLVDEILDLSKVESEHMSIEKVPFDLTELVGDVTDSLNLKASEKGLSLTTSFSGPENKGVISDPSRLRQVMVNVIGNAIKFTDKGHVDVNVSLAVNENEPASGTVVINVQDSGIGLTPKQANVLFQPFAQGDASMSRRFGGTGLGLFLSRKIAQLMGGNVSLDWSEPGHGSRFQITITVDLIEIKGKSMTAAPTPPSSSLSQKGRVLIVDDAIDNRLLLEILLKRYGVETVSASNGQEAVDTAMNSFFDMILMDVQMPVMDGFEAVKYLRERNYGQPVIALTAHAMRGDRERCIDAGFNDYLQKPINRQALESCLAHYVPGSTPNRSPEL